MCMYIFMDIKSITKQFTGLLHKKGEQKKEETSQEQGEESESKEEKLAEDKELLTKILESISTINKDVSDHFTQVENRVTALETKSNDDSQYKEIRERLLKVESTLGEFSKIYEMVTAQYSPFLDDDSQKPQQQTKQAQPTQVQQTPVVEKEETSSKQVEEQTSAETQSTPNASTLLNKANSQEKSQEVQRTQSQVEEQTTSSSHTDKGEVTKVMHDLEQQQVESVPVDPAQFVQYISNQASEEHAFVLHSNTKIFSLTELFLELYHMSDADFASHVTGERHDFATWVKEALQADDLAKELYECSSRMECVTLLGSILESS